MEMVDKKIAFALNEAHRKVEERLNAKRRPKAPFEDGSWVWLVNPKKVGGQKIERWWRGPFQVVQRVGEASFQIRTDRSVLYDVHRDQLKPCLWDMDLGPSYPLVFRQGDQAAQRTGMPVVDKVLEHREHPTRGLEFLVHWVGPDQDFLAWESAGNFLHGCPDAWLTYCHNNDLTVDVHQAVESLGRVAEPAPEPQDD